MSLHVVISGELQSLKHFKVIIISRYFSRMEQEEASCGGASEKLPHRINQNSFEPFPP